MEQAGEPQARARGVREPQPYLCSMSAHGQDAQCGRIARARASRLGWSDLSSEFLCLPPQPSPRALGPHSTATAVATCDVTN
eukprot:scaffold118539_cov31-Tisochrysis_lutea.AAC.1